MYSVALNHTDFDVYSLSDGDYSMPTDDTVVSLDKSFSPVSYFKDEKWDFNDFFNTNGAPKSQYIFRFPKGKHNAKLLLELKQRAYFLVWGGKGRLLDVGNSFRKIESCFNIIRYTEKILRCFKNTQINHLSMLSNELVFHQLLQNLSSLAENTSRVTLNNLSVLSHLNSYFPKERHFELCLPEGKTINQVAKKYSLTGKGHYPTVIPVIYEQLMGQLINDVETAFLDLNILKDVKEFAQRKNISEQEAVEAFRVYESACFVTCSAFTGMRISELQCITHDSYKEIEVEGITLPTLRSWTRKLEKISREDVWACSPICQKALSVLRELNSDHRSEKNNIHISPRFSFDRQAKTGNNIKCSKKEVLLNTKGLSDLFKFYSNHINIQYIPSTMNEAYSLLNPVISERFEPRKQREDETIYWHFSSHSLRRSFAHFVVGNGLVSLASLKQQFKHIHLSMTAIYASHSDVLTLLGIENQASIKRDIEQAEEVAHIKYLKDMVEHPEEQSGGFMKAFEGDPRVMTEKEFESLAKKTKGANKTTGYGRCFAGVKCKLAHIFEPSNCVAEDCENLNINKEEAFRWQKRHRSLCSNIEKMKQLGLFNRNTLARELTDIRAAEKVMFEHGIDFNRFELGSL
jgi:integrase